MKKKLACIFFLLFFYSPFSFAIDTNMYEGEVLWEKVGGLDWIYGPKEIKHTNQGKVNLKEGEMALLNDDAKQLLYWFNGAEFTSTLLVTSDDLFSYIDYQYVNEGYVKLDDWKDVNPDKFIKQMRSDAKEVNKIRKENNRATVETIQWAQEPTLDKETKSVYYALIVEWSDGYSSINAKTLLLGRYGYTRITYTGDPETFKINKDLILSNIVSGYNFIEEKKYSNFTTGDKVAAAGIGGLLAASMGIKAFKAGGLAAILLILKKAWFILLIPFIFAWGFIKRLFSKNS